MNPKKEVAAIRRHFESIGTEARAIGEKHYLKSSFSFLGATVPETRACAKEWVKKHPLLDRDQLLALVHELWSHDVFELSNLGAEVLNLRSDLLQSKDMKLVAELIGKTDTWAHVDKLATDVAGALVRRFKSARRELERWNRDPNFWLRRASLLALLRDLRKGDGDIQLFERLALPLFSEKEFFIRKAIGWVLRDAGKATPEIVAAFLDRHAEAMSLLSVQVAAKVLAEPEGPAFIARSKAANAKRRAAAR